MFRPGSTTSPTNLSPTPRWSLPSARPTPPRELELKPGGPKAQIVISMPDGSVLTIETDDIKISFDRSFTEVTTRSDSRPVYLVDRGTFTIEGRL